MTKKIIALALASIMTANANISHDVFMTHAVKEVNLFITKAKEVGFSEEEAVNKLLKIATKKEASTGMSQENKRILIGALIATGVIIVVGGVCYHKGYWPFNPETTPLQPVQQHPAAQQPIAQPLIAGQPIAQQPAAPQQDEELIRVTRENLERIDREIRANYTDQERARIHRAQTGNYTGQDVDAGFANLDRILNDANEDLSLRRIIGQAVRRGQHPLTDAELRQIPLFTFHRAGALIQDNLYGWNRQATLDDVNTLIDRHLSR